ncbi:MAG: hypothetical protein IT365_19120, partial [Candidatus Hydrogenedentes bacterium]|nr:hypothetical protein [Candidatus Hydrogenedentota bacterium]
AVRNTHWIIIWTFLSWSFGPILNLMDHFRYTTLLVRRMLHSSWSTVSYFVVPVLVVDKVNVFSALRRSVDVMSKTWGKGAISRLGLYWFFLLLNLPTIAMFAMGHYPEGPWPTSLTLVVLLYFYTTIVVYQTASSVLSVVLYKYASEGKVVPGFKEEHLKNAFVQPILYVLATEPPGPDFRPLQEVKEETAAAVAPNGENNDAPEPTTEASDALGENVEKEVEEPTNDEATQGEIAAEQPDESSTDKA